MTKPHLKVAERDRLKAVESCESHVRDMLEELFESTESKRARFVVASLLVIQRELADERAEILKARKN